MMTPAQSIAEGCARLEKALQRFAQPSADHWLADMVMLAFAEQIVENARSVDRLTGTRPVLHATPAARAAFEAAQNLLMLTSAPDYDEAGALAYVYSMRKDDKMREANASAFENAPPEEFGPGWFEGALAEMVETTNLVRPGEGARLTAANAALAERGRRGGDNWHGMNPADEIAKRMVARLPPGQRDETDAAASFSRLYAALCRDTHSRTTIRPLGVSSKGHGALETILERRDPESTERTSTRVAVGSLTFGLVAIEYRKRIA